MLKEKLLAGGVKWLTAAKGFAILHAPAALVAIGAGLVIWAIVETAKAASDPNDELEQEVGDLESANEALKQEDITPEEADSFRKEKRKALRKVVKEFIRQFKKPIALATLGLSAMVGGYLWVAKRFAAAAAEAAAVSATLATVDRNLRKTFGDGVANAMYSDDFDPNEFDKKYFQAQGEKRENPDAPFDRGAIANEYVSELIGDEDCPDRNLYHWNKNTTEDRVWNSQFGYRVQWLKWTVADLQNDLDNKPEVTHFTREQILDRLGLHAATVHPATVKGEKDARDDGHRAVCKGERIDLGLSELFEAIEGRLGDKEWLAYLEDKYQDIVIHINCDYSQYKRAKLYNPVVREHTWIGEVPKKFRPKEDDVA
jgi:hypothetical protein